MTRSWMAWLAGWTSVVMALVACSDDSVVQSTGGGEDTHEPGSVTVAFLSPSTGEVFEATGPGADIVAEFQVLGLDLVEGGPYLSVTLDGTEVGTLVATKTFTYASVPIGTHTLGVQALRGEGNPYPGAEYADEISVEVKAKAAPECTTDAECASKAQGVCQSATCDTDAGVCHVVDEPTSTSCDDGDACTDDDHCDSGACVAGKPHSCTDDNPCTDDACDAADGCTFTNNVASCDDGDACTTADQCQNGACVGGPDTCGECTVDADCADKEDGDLCNGTLKCDAGACVLDETTVVECAPAATACKSVACNPATGACEDVNAAAGTACDDGDACTIGDACADGACGSGAPKACDDGNLCTTDACDSASGACTTAPIDLGCDDGNACTADACDPATGACASVPDVFCDDGDACTDDVCDETTGDCSSKPAVACDDGDPCTDDACDPETGSCGTSPSSGAACDDGLPCTTNDACDNGTCVGGDPKSCNDDNPCTTDQCNPATGACAFSPNTDPCDDGDSCTTVDVCSNGSCVGGSPKSCDDGDPCTDDSCDGSTGACSSAPNTAPCDDGDPCTQGDVCAAGSCTPGSIVPSCALTAEAICAVAGPTGTTVECPITHARFDELTQLPGTLHFVIQYEGASLKMEGLSDEVCVGATCFVAPVPPNKLSPSGHTAKLTPASSANWAGNVDVQLANLSDPSSALTTAWLGTDGSISGEAGILTLNVTTKVDVSVDAPVFVYLANVTSWDTNSNAMNTWVQDGLIVSAPKDRCIPAAGALCDDGNACNGVESCDGPTSTCVAGVAPFCGDGTIDASCGEVCDDGNTISGDGCNAACTSTEKCGNGVKDPGEVCDDGNTTPGDGCNAACTSTEICQNGFLDPGEECDIGPDVVGDACSPDCKTLSLECTVDADCSDDDVCTGAETCVLGSCKAGTALTCSDGVPCTKDVCDPVTGCSSTPDDLACSDDNDCTEDICDPVGGCQQFVVAPGAPCEDGNPCTTGDSCLGVTCKAGTAVDCSDGIDCTMDSCTAEGTCVNVANNDACDDGSPCTANACDALDGCYAIPLSAIPCSDGDPCTQNDACLDGACVPGGPHPGCGAPPGYVCDLSGNTGDTVSCSIRVARQSDEDPSATGIEFAVDYDPAVMQLDNFYDDLCFAGFGCFETAVTGSGSTPLSSGHTVSIAPTKVANWAGTGAVVVVNTSDPTVPLSEAWVDDLGVVQGEAELMRMKFKLLQDVSAAAPAKVELSELVGADGEANTLVSEIINMFIITWAQ